jgi:ABC-type Fe3+-hydroxamate transport system substrate-binding protein
MHFTDQTGYEFELKEKRVNIVSLVPSQTELLFDLGLDQQVKGITKFCIHPSHWKNTKTIVGGTKKIRMEKIQSLHPDLIIANKEENTKEEIEYLRQHYPVYTSDINDLEEALKMISEVGILVDKKEAANSIIEEIRKSFEALKSWHHTVEVTQQEKYDSKGDTYNTKLPDHKLNVAYLIWRNPYMAAGSDTFIHSMIEACGWENALENFPRYPEVQLNQNPEIHNSQNLPDLSSADIILLSSEPYPFAQKHIDEIQSFLPGKLILLVDGEMFSWYGSRLLKSAAYFRELIDQIHSLIGR